MFVRFGFLLLISICFCFSMCATCNSNNLVADNNPYTVIFIGKVVSVNPNITVNNKLRNKFWRIDINVSKVVQNSTNMKIIENDNLCILIHSVIKIFMNDNVDVVGQTYKFFYEDEFSKIYSGGLKIEEGTVSGLEY